MERDSDPERERDREEREESDEDDEERLRELRDDAECRFGEVTLCHGSIHSSLGRRELEIPSAFALGFSLSSPSSNSSFFPASLSDFNSKSALFS